MKTTFEMIQETKQFIESKISIQPEYGIILGTGLGRLADSIEKDVVIPYEEIPHFPVSTVEAHAGKLIIGTLAGKKVMAMQGRFHYYEGYYNAADRLPCQSYEIHECKDIWLFQMHVVELIHSLQTWNHHGHY